MKRNQRLRTPADFRHVRESAARTAKHPLVVLYVASNELSQARVGITVSSRVGNAVVRNRVRRRLKEAIQARFAELGSGLDLLLVARPVSARATWAELSRALDSVLARAGATAATGRHVEVAVNGA